jgi:hypothetical protein
LRGKRSAQNAATPDGPSSLITNAAKYAPNRPAPRSRARKAGASPQHPAGWQPPGHRSRGRATLPAPPTPDPERRAATAEALRCLHACSSSAQTKDCKRCKRNSGLGPWSKRMDLTPASTDPCPHGRNARPETPCSLALSLADKKKGFSTSPKTLAITDRGDRIRTCDLVLPKQ